MSVTDERSGERGASALLIAISMLLLMGVAAVVIDAGFGFNERRQAQAGVDFASLAALNASIGANPEDAGAAEAMTVVAANLPGRVLDWVTCADPSRPAEYVIVSSLTPCVSFTVNFGQARVRLPTDAVDTTFGRIIGFDQIDVRATAEAIQSSLATADILPLTVGTGSSVCLFSNQAPQTVPPCNGPNSGFFGYLDIALHGSPPAQLDNPPTCEQGSTNTRLPINITKGADHLMVEWNAGDPVVDDWAMCPNLSEDINQLHVETGSPTGAITDGLIDGISGSINGQAFGPGQGRLVPTAASVDTTSVRGTVLDNTPLWEFLNSVNCPWSGSVSGPVDSHDEMVFCLNDWNTMDGDIFMESLEDHRRFGAVPVFSPFPSGPGAYLIDSFAPVWIETIYQNCNANRCRTVFTPFDAPDSTVTDPCPAVLVAGTINCGHNHTSGPDDVEGVTALQLEIEMLHPNTQEFFPGSNSLREIHLLK